MARGDIHGGPYDVVCIGVACGGDCNAAAGDDVSIGVTWEGGDVFTVVAGDVCTTGGAKDVCIGVALGDVRTVAA